MLHIKLKLTTHAAALPTDTPSTPVVGSKGQTISLLKVVMLHIKLKGIEPRLAIDRSICILTRPVVITGFNRSLLVNWWLIGRLKKLG